MKSHYVESIPSVKKLSDIINNPEEKALPSRIKTEIINVFEGVERLDGEVKQKEQLLVQKESVINQRTAEVRNKDSLLVQKEQKLQETITDMVQKEFADVIHKLQPDLHYGTAEDFQVYIQGKLIIESKNYALMQNDLPFYKEKLLIKEFTEVLNKLHPDEYPTKNPNDWKDNYGKHVIESKNYALMQNDLPIFKQDLLRREFIDVLHKLYPSEYPTKNADDWKDSWGKRVVDSKNYEVIEDKLPIFKQLLLSQIENVLNSKDQVLVVKDNEMESLRNLLLQKEVELANKSLVQNQVVKETEKLLTEQDIRLQNLLELNGKLDAKMEYARKEIEIREAEKNILSKMLIQKHEILNNLLVQKESEVNEKSFEKNLLINQLRKEIEGLNKQIWEHNQHITHSILLDDVGCQPGKQLLESLNLSSINLSPINHGEQNQIVGNIIGNFDNQHITHSVILGGEGSESFVIVDTENIH